MVKTYTSLLTIERDGAPITDPVPLTDANDVRVNIGIGWRTLLGALVRRRRIDLAVRVFRVTIEIDE